MLVSTIAYLLTYAYLCTVDSPKGKEEINETH